MEKTKFNPEDFEVESMVDNNNKVVKKTEEKSFSRKIVFEEDCEFRSLIFDQHNQDGRLFIFHKKRKGKSIYLIKDGFSRLNSRIRKINWSFIVMSVLYGSMAVLGLIGVPIDPNLERFFSLIAYLLEYFLNRR